MRRGVGYGVGLCLLAMVLDLTRLHAWQNSDNLIPTLVSLEAWTPYFWSQDRYGMLMPLLLGGIRDPLYNQLAISFASFLGGLCAVMATAQLFFGGSRAWGPIGLASLVLLLGTASESLIFNVIGPAQFFSTPMAMGLCAIGWLEHRPQLVWRLLAGLMLMLAAWVNCVSPVWLGILYVAKRFAPCAHKPTVLKTFSWRGRTFGCLRVGSMLALAWGAGLIAMYLAPEHDVHLTQLLGVRATAHSCVQLGRHCAAVVAQTPALVWSLALAAVVGAGRLLWLRRVDRFAQSSLAAASAAAAYMLLSASQDWVATNEYDSRFWVPAGLVLLVALVGAAIGAFAQAMRAEPSACLHAVLGCAALMAIVSRWGLLPLNEIEAIYIKAAEPLLSASTDLGCSHLAGNYWRVWPAVFAADFQHYRHPDKAPLYAITHRSTPSMHLWPDDSSSWRICVMPDYKTAKKYMPKMKYTEVERSALLVVMRPDEAPKPAP